LFPAGVWKVRSGAGRTTDAEAFVTGGNPTGVAGPTWVQAERRVAAVRRRGRDMAMMDGVLAGTGRGFVKSWDVLGRFWWVEGWSRVRLVLAAGEAGCIFLG
jgi:hypothetical protein